MLLRRLDRNGGWLNRKDRRRCQRTIAQLGVGANGVVADLLSLDQHLRFFERDEYPTAEQLILRPPIAPHDAAVLPRLRLNAERRGVNSPQPYRTALAASSLPLSDRM